MSARLSAALKATLLLALTPFVAHAQVGVSITPSSGSYATGTQLPVSIHFCATPEQYYSTHGITFNGVDVTPTFASGGGYDPNCVFQQTWNGTVTLIAGTNTLAAGFTAYYFDGADVYYETSYSNSATYTGNDVTLPTITLVAPAGEVTTQYPTITLEWCDNLTLNASSRSIIVNGANRTGDFNYTTLGAAGCGNARAQSTTATVPLNVGANSISAYICDLTGNCTTQPFTIYRRVEGPPTVALRNFNGDNQDRSLCLTVGAGQAGGLSCGDLFVIHGLPSYATMGRDRSLSLFYNSASAAPRPVVAVNVSQSATTATPTAVYAELRINGTLRASGTFAAFGTGSVNQIALAYDAKDDTSGLYDFSLLVRNQYAGGPQDVTVTGSLIVANRSWSEFGAGWWLQGVEQLITGQSSNRILWLGGDGSAAVYNNLASNTWVRAPGAFRDTLVFSPGAGTYTRTLEHGIQVVFNSAGRHLQTINRVGQVSTFAWGAPPGYPALTRLLSVTVPPAGVSGTSYTLAYAGTSQFVSWIEDPAGRRISPNVATYLYGTKFAPNFIADPDGNQVNFSYDGVGRMTGRRTRRGYWTTYSYTGQLHVDSARVPVGGAPGDTAITVHQWWDERGLAFGAAGGTLTAVDTASVNTKVFGPRRNANDDATFVVDRFGAPLRTVDPAGAVTTVVRGDAAVPALPTELRYQDGRIVKMSYNARGNLVQMRDSTSHLGVAGQPTAVSRWTYSSSNAPDSPDSVIDGEGVATTYTYNTWGLMSESRAPNGHRTIMEFVPSGPLQGLVRAVIEDQVVVYDSVANARVTANLRTAFGFNTLGNVVSDTSPAGRARSYTRDVVQRVIEAFDPAGVKTTLGYDALNRQVRSTQYVEAGDSLTTTTTYTIDVVTSVVDPRGVTRSWQYDFADRQTAELDDYNRLEERWYNLAGQVDSLYPRYFRYTPTYAGRKVRNTYDAAGRLQRTSWPARELLAADSSAFTYDIMGRMLTAQRVGNANQTGRLTTRAYFANGALRTESQDNAINFAYAYDRAGRRTWYRTGTAGNLTQSDSIWYSYAPVTGDLTKIGVRWRGTSPVKDSVLFTWDALGRRSQLTYSNSAVVRHVYDRDGHTRFVCGKHPGGPAATDVYDFTVFHSWIDPRGLTRRTTNYTPTGWTADCSSNQSLQNIHTMTYDLRGQMLTQQAVGLNHTYQYDPSGNMIRDTETSPVSQDRIMTIETGHNRLLQWRSASNPNSGRDYTFDSSGNRLDELPAPVPNSFGRRTIWYDGLGRTTGTSEYVGAQWVPAPYACNYDGVGRLVFPCVTLGTAAWLGYDGNNVVRTGPDWDDSGWTFVHGPGTDDPIMGYHRGYNQRWYWVTDGQGRQYAVGDRAGNNGLTSSYYEAGNKGARYAGGTQNAASFGATRNQNAQMYQLSFFRNRFYDQATARWTQEDPSGVAGGANLYAYVGNNPAAYTDPFGLKPCPPDNDCGPVLFSGFVVNLIVGAGITVARGTYQNAGGTGRYFRLGIGVGLDVSAGAEAGQSDSRDALGGAGEAVCVGAVGANVCRGSNASGNTTSAGVAAGPTEIVVSGHGETTNTWLTPQTKGAPPPHANCDTDTRSNSVCRK